MNIKKLNGKSIYYCKNKIALIALSISLLCLTNFTPAKAQKQNQKPVKVNQQGESTNGEPKKKIQQVFKDWINKRKAQTKKNKSINNATKQQAKPKQPAKKSSSFNKLNRNKAVNTKQKRGALYIDTLYYIEPIPSRLNYATLLQEELAEPISIDEASGKKREVEIGEHEDHFYFNTWEIPTQPDEFIQEKIENYNSILPLVFNDDVKLAIKEFTQSKVNRRWLEDVLGRMQMYFPLYEKVFDQYGIPVEMKYLSVIESGLNPKATSPMGAKGLWQFIPETAYHYGLKNNSVIDEARDPKKATRAAAKYLNKMYTEFGDWFLSMCAYNCGPGNVRKALRRSTDGRDFWSIKKYLPRETRRYIPKFIASVYILNNYKAYNLKPKELDYDLQRTDTIHLHQKMNTNDLVKYCGIKKDHIRILNPILKTNETPEPNPTFVFNIPYSKLENVLYYREEIMRKEESKSKTIPELGSAHLSGEIKHKVKAGESLDVISKKYGVSIGDLKRWNGLSDHIIRIGQDLYVYK